MQEKFGSFSPKICKLSRARFLLYPSRFLQPNTHFLKAFFDTLQIQIVAKVSETFSFSNFFSESPSGHDRRWRTWWTRAGGRMEPIVPCTHGENWPSDLLWVLPPGHGVWWVRSSLVSPLSILPSCQSTLEVHPRPHSQVSSSFWKPLTWIIISQYSSLWAFYFFVHTTLPLYSSAQFPVQTGKHVSSWFPSFLRKCWTPFPRLTHPGSLSHRSHIHFYSSWASAPCSSTSLGWFNFTMSTSVNATKCRFPLYFNWMECQWNSQWKSVKYSLRTWEGMSWRRGKATMKISAFSQWKLQGKSLRVLTENFNENAPSSKYALK